MEQKGRRGWHATRRDFLRVVGAGGAAAILGRGHAAAGLGTTPPDSTPVDSMPIDEGAGWRQQGGPTVEQLARDLDFDIDRIFRFVADEVLYDPYPGVLRGAKGTLWSRAGNAADQAVLLAALLSEALVETRFVTGTLDDPNTARLLDAARVARDEYRRLTRSLFRPSATLSADEIDATLLSADRQIVEALPARSRELIDVARTQLDDGIATITSALAAAGIELPDNVLSLPARERDEHVWVQYAAGSKWIDLDPTLPGAEPATTLTEAANTLAALPDELRHTVTISLTAEAITAGAPVPVDLLTYTTFTEDLVGLPISIGHAKPEGLDGLGAALTATFDGTIQYVPVVLVGDQGEFGTGRVTFATGEGLASVFDETGNDGDTLGEWLDITFSSPDAAPRTVRREIFDRVGYLERTRGSVDLSTVEPVELVDIDADIRDEFLPLRSIWSIAVTGGEVPWSFFEQDATVADIFADLGTVSTGYYLVRHAAEIEAASEHGHRFATDGPNAIAFVAGPTAVTTSGPQLGMTLDILSRCVTAVPYADSAASAHPLVVAGVLSHVAERIGRGEWGGASGSISVGRVFDEAARAGIPIRVIGPDGAGIDELDVSDEALVRISAASSDGLLVIVPERSVDLGDRPTSGWWLVDPTTGATADELDNGLGVTLTEHMSILQTRFRAWGGFARLGGCVGKYAVIGAAALNIIGDPDSTDAAAIAMGAAQAALEGASDGLGSLGC